MSPKLHLNERSEWVVRQRVIQLSQQLPQSSPKVIGVPYFNPGMDQFSVDIYTAMAGGCEKRN